MKAKKKANPKSAPYGHCSGCTDPRFEGTHYEGTIEHPSTRKNPSKAAAVRLPVYTDKQRMDWLEKRHHNFWLWSKKLGWIKVARAEINAAMRREGK